MAEHGPAASPRLKKAAAAEHARLERRAARVGQTRARLVQRLDQADAELADIRARQQLLGELAGDTPAPALPAPAPGFLSGPEIRRKAISVLLTEAPDMAGRIHYRQWYDLVAARHPIRGTDPLAVFLTQITRSPIVQGHGRGIYSIDREAPDRLREALAVARERLDVCVAAEAPEHARLARQLAAHLEEAEECLRAGEEVVHG